MVLSVVTFVPLASRDEGDSRVAPRAGGRAPTGTHQDGLHQPPLRQGRAVHPGDVLQRGQRGLRVPGGDVEPSGFGDELGADDKEHGNRKRRGPRGRGRHRATCATVPAPADGTDVAREEARRSPAFRGGSERTRPRGPCRRPSPRDGGADSALHASLARATY